ncbi:MAG TPA: hypothetical protein VJY33_12605, partial [Isosphaeraceae bacterium]|nr:hypothetical protein [Isosphaeraceae bacterium]
NLDALQKEVASLRARQAVLEEQVQLKASVFEYVKSLNLVSLEDCEHVASLADGVSQCGLSTVYRLDLSALDGQDGVLTPQQKREVLLALGCQVVIADKQVHVELSVPCVRSATVGNGSEPREIVVLGNPTDP